MTAPVWLILALLSDFYLTVFLARMRGPLGLGTWLRSAVGVEPDPITGGPAHDKLGDVLLNSISRHTWIDAVAHEIARGMTCTFCCAFWVSLVMTLVVGQRVPELISSVTAYLVTLLALSAGVYLLDRRT